MRENFLRGRLVRNGSDAVFDSPLGRIALSGAGMPLADEAVVLGIRPEHLRIGPPGEEEAHNWTRLPDLSVRLVEPLGSSIDVHLGGSNGDRIVARVPSAAKVSVSQRVEVYVDASAAHLFAADDGGRRLN